MSDSKPNIVCFPSDAEPKLKFYMHVYKCACLYLVILILFDSRNLNLPARFLQWPSVYSKGCYLLSVFVVLLFLLHLILNFVLLWLNKKQGLILSFKNVLRLALWPII